MKLPKNKTKQKTSYQDYSKKSKLFKEWLAKAEKYNPYKAYIFKEGEG